MPLLTATTQRPCSTVSEHRHPRVACACLVQVSRLVCVSAQTAMAFCLSPYDAAKVALREPQKIHVSTLASLEPRSLGTSIATGQYATDEPRFVRVPEPDVHRKMMCVKDMTYDVTWILCPDFHGKRCEAELPRLEQALQHFLPQALAARMPFPPYNIYDAGARVPGTAIVKNGDATIGFRFRRHKNVFWVSGYRWVEMDGSSVERWYDHAAGGRVLRRPKPSAV